MAVEREERDIVLGSKVEHGHVHSASINTTELYGQIVKQFYIYKIQTLF